MRWIWINASIEILLLVSRSLSSKQIAKTTRYFQGTKEKILSQWC